LSTSPIQIRPFQDGDSTAFRDLNEEWIAKHFTLEEQDRITFGNPELSVLQPGGHIFMAVDGDSPVGCCALLPVGSGVFELGKMAVAPDYRGRGIGRMILEYAISKARDMGARSLHLASNTSLANAVHLYESVGFRHVPAEHLPPSQYVRSNVFMDLHL
jgi:putative acetyltransferase